MNIESMVSRLTNLSAKSTLSKVEREEVRTLMRQLKAAGFSNDEISEISKGKWTPSTVKFYTPGIKATHPSQWEDSVALLDKLISSGLTLDDVETAVTVSEDLKSHGINLDNVIDLLLTVNSSSLEIADLINQYKLFGESGLSPNNISEALSLKDELETKGLGLDSLVPLVELAKNYGEAAQVIEAFSHYISLNELKDKITVANSELESVNQELSSANKHLDETRSELSRVQEPLKTHEEVKKLGFGEPELLKLTNLAKKYGTVKKVLNAVEAYVDNAEINEEINKAKTRLANLEAKIGQLETSYSHLKTAINMCDALIQQYKFGLDAITAIFATAKKYGDPLELLKAIESYGKLQALQQEVIKLQSKLTESKIILAQSEGKYQEILEKIESLNATALKVGAAVSKVENQLENSKDLQKLINLINNPASVDYDAYGPLVLVVAVSLRKWVVNYEHKFKLAYNIKNGLESLISELGGK